VGSVLVLLQSTDALLKGIASPQVSWILAMILTVCLVVIDDWITLDHRTGVLLQIVVS